MLARRQFSLGFGVTVVAGAMARSAGAAQAQDRAWSQELHRRFGEIEARSGGRLGIGILDTQTGCLAGYRGDERFPMCSTHKALSAAAVLAKVDQGREHLDRRMHFEAEQVLPYSPGTKAHAGAEGMAIASICEAAVTLSDNTAANLMLDAIGGPAGLMTYLRGIGDTVTRLDRTEPTLNEALPGDPRDTTSPLAMAVDLNRVVLGDALSPASRELLATWLVAGKTGDARLRAGVPQGWRVGEKTGTGTRGTANDVGVIWPPDRKPVIVAAFITGSNVTLEGQSVAIADAARAIVLALPDC